jgi:hypothetical protein
MDKRTSEINNLLEANSSATTGTVNFSYPIASLLGHTGVGKTHIYNKLCNTQHATKYNKGSLTYEIRLNDVAHGKNKF